MTGWPVVPLFAVLLALAAACGQGDQEGQPVAADYEESRERFDEHAESHAPAEDLVRIPREMLRDLRVTTAPAELRPPGEAANLLGEVRVNEDAYAEIGSQIRARVTRLLASPGDVVAAGQPLVELDSAEVGRARADLETAKARLDLARRTLARRRPLAAQGIVPRRELEAAETELAEAQATYRAAEQTLASLGALGGRGARFVLVSPIAGSVIERQAFRGRLVDAEERLFVVTDLARVWLVVHGFERDAVRVRPGTTARATFPALPGQTFSGTVTRVGSRVDPASRTIEIRIELDNVAGQFRPGMSGSALVPLGAGEPPVVAVPAAALQRVRDGWCVFVPRDEATFEIRPVGRGRDLGGEVEVLAGLRPGEAVVVQGAFLLKAEWDKARGGGEEHEH